MTTLTLVRHGQTDWNLEQRLQGHLDNPLNATGIEQALQIAEKLSTMHFDMLYCSDLPRARQTGEIIAAKLGMALILDKRLREISHGRWEGHTFLEAADLFPDDVALWQKHMLDAKVPGAETANEVADRLRDFADEVHGKFPQGNVLVVSHGFAIGELLCLARGLPLTQSYELTPENTEAITIDWPRPE